jgi:hypothetical protein
MQKRHFYCYFKRQIECEKSYYYLKRHFYYYFIYQGFDAEQVNVLSQLSCTIHSTSSEYAEKFWDSLRRRTYTTPTSYLELIKLFCELLKEKRGELDEKLNRYKVGVKKLEETQVMVSDLQVKLTKMAPEIEIAKKDTAELMIKVEADSAVAAEQQAGPLKWATNFFADFFFQIFKGISSTKNLYIGILLYRKFCE